MTNSRCRVIILNGASSSGKTTIARALQAELDHPAMLISHDTFVGLLPEGHFQTETKAEYSHRLEHLFRAANRASAAILEVGYDVIIDTVMSHWCGYRDWIDLFGTHVLLVGVHCPVNELEQREQARGDRSPGMARRQLRWVHNHGVYDLELDTGTLSLAECARRIKFAFVQLSPPTALQRLKTRFERGEITQDYLWETG